MSKRIVWIILLILIAGVCDSQMLPAQVIPVRCSFCDMTFNGMTDVTGPVVFDDCTFITDSVLIRHSQGALFRNCRFESRSGVLYVTESGDGIILVDCSATGCNELYFSRNTMLSDRNYIAGIVVNGEECTVFDDQELIMDIDGMELSEIARGSSSGPLFISLSAITDTLRGGDRTELTLRGLDNGMFAGWSISDSIIAMSLDESGFRCCVSAPDSICERMTVLVSATTEHGLEAACMLTLLPDEPVVEPVESKGKIRKRRRK